MSPPTQDPKRLRRRRIEAGLNQKELAEAAGVSPSHMSLLERGLRGASPRVLKRFTETLNCEVEDLMPPEPEPREDEAGAA
ncbi:helix-turn-helix domain-containing protein [Streptomyces spinosisporus]|uniref:Helix-turn-helix transcriptional regulator n=1 Tax=Streptomyces spinosisporus TaxID=2927582 RepID=A0ABS9XDR3_9ACTN|nr:helix-turn-helix transcriptional regulator [Streptomyces spinosisporus]MCI3240234.1 helix-turn-helix transcriptional regulator [Streptomyces spinosisporus]